MDDYEGHLEYSEASNWPTILDPSNRNGWYFYLKDQVGTVYKVVDGKTNAIVDSRVYDVFGNLISQSGTSKSNIGFQGKYYDKESGLYYFYNRYYLPSIGRFTTEDPIKFMGGLNFFCFEKNNPVIFNDEYGLKEKDCPKCPDAPPLTDQNWCRDAGFSAFIGSFLHPGQTCFRAIDGSGKHCCYPELGGEPQGHIDLICPASGRNSDGICSYTDKGRIIRHSIIEVDIIRNLCPISLFFCALKAESDKRK